MTRRMVNHCGQWVERNSHQATLNKLDAAIKRVTHEPKSVEDRIREIHSPILVIVRSMTFQECAECGSLYPCATVEALLCG